MTQTAQRLLADIRKLAPHITSRAAEIEAGHRTPIELVEALRSTGVFRMFVPQSHGGLELDLPAALEVIGALGRIDGSLGWTAMVGAGSAIFVPYLPRETFDQVYQDGPDMIIAASAQPAGTAEAVADGWRINGRWPFMSGCQHADWILGFCVVSADIAGFFDAVSHDWLPEGGKRLLAPTGQDGPPMLRGFMLPAHNWQIEDTWYAAGLKGTGSHHVMLRDMLVPAANSFDPVSGGQCQPGPLYQAVLGLIPLLHCAFAVGIAEGTLEELVELANTGRRQQRAAVPMRASEIFQYELGRIDAELRAARAFSQVQAGSHWGHALGGTLNGEALLAEGTQTAIWVTAACIRVVDACFAVGGGSALYESSPLQRRMRDLHAAAQHVGVQQRHYANSGKVLLDSSTVNSKIVGDSLAGSRGEG
jgi:alkylation response protein AidB-like acyl-CoA dehydrogenase